MSGCEIGRVFGMVYPHQSNAAAVTTDSADVVTSDERGVGAESQAPEPIPDPPEIAGKTQRWKDRGILACVILLTTYIMVRPSVDQMRTTLPQNLGDPGLNTWILAWQTHALTTHPSQWFGGNIFFPYGNSLGYSELMLPLLPFFGAVYLVTGNAILAHNLVILGLIPFCLWTTFRLSRYLGCSPIGSYCAAIAFTFNAYTYAHASHLQ